MKLQAAVLRQIHAEFDRALPVVKAVALCGASPIIDGRKIGRIPAVSVAATSTGPFFPVALAPSRIVAKEPYSTKDETLGVSVLAS